jgi:predicted PurR-regulated permease PerM
MAWSAPSWSAVSMHAVCRLGRELGRLPDRIEGAGYPMPGTEDHRIPRILAVLVSFAAAVIVVAGLRGAASLVGPAFLALMLTVVVHPLHGWAARRRWPTWVGTVVGLVGVYLLLVGLALSLVVAIARFGTLLPSYQQEFDDLVNRLRSPLAALGIGADQLESMFRSLGVGRVAGLVAGTLDALLGVLSNLFLIVALLFFMGIDAAGFGARMPILAASRPDFARALSSFARGTRRYLVVSTVFGLIVAVIDVVVLWLLGVPAPLLWGLLAFITNYIPNVGFVLGLVPPAALALLEGGPGLMIAVIAAYAIINVVIQTVIQPKFVGDAVGLSATVTFLSLLFWAWVLGPLGALLAVPLTLFARAVLLEADPLAGWANLLVAGGNQQDDGEAG